ncbi:hypothetical protein [Herbidospora yilanensis]|uniref:hypothetical protein n=1 Tax=Herbidospora yilanensis TaxID=354426 RepID=UPI00078579A3|nr:hypothetical protein [Herbidospora yilanensis]
MAESVYVLGDEDRKRFSRLVAAAWSDDAVKTRYGHEPRVMLAEYGIGYPAGVPTPPLPVRPEGEFELEELEVAAGAQEPSCVSCIQCVGTVATLYTTNS